MKYNSPEVEIISWICTFPFHSLHSGHLPVISDHYLLLYKVEKPSVRLRHADNSTMSARIETRLAGNESCVFEDHKVYF